MSYIGNTIQNQNYSPAVDTFSGNGSTVAFTLSRPVASVYQIQVVVNNVQQNPISAYSVNGNTLTFTGAPTVGTNNIYVYYASPNITVVQPGTGTVGTSQLVDGSIVTSKIAAAAIGSTQIDPSAQYYGFKNRIINGAMMIDQRNAGASVSTTNTFPVDRFNIQNTGTSTFSAARSTTVPNGFINSLNYTVGAGASVGATDVVFFRQIIEGVNGSDFGWGTASASNATLSFWVRSSLTGTFGVTLQNYSANRSYVASYTIASANTWAYISVTVPGDTTGTWNTDTANGWCAVIWDLGVGSTYSNTAGSWAGANYRGLTSGTKLSTTSGATFYITGVQLEKGSTATSFDYRPYGTELALCQRYLPAYNFTNSAQSGFAIAQATGAGTGLITLVHPVQTRVPPTSMSTPNATRFSAMNNVANAVNAMSTLAFSSSEDKATILTFSGSSGLTAGNATTIYALSGAQILLNGCEL